MYAKCIFIIHSSTSGHSGCFSYCLMWILLQHTRDCECCCCCCFSQRNFILLDYITRSRIAKSHDKKSECVFVSSIISLNALDITIVNYFSGNSYTCNSLGSVAESVAFFWCFHICLFFNAPCVPASMALQPMVQLPLPDVTTWFSCKGRPSADRPEVAVGQLCAWLFWFCVSTVL